MIVSQFNTFVNNTTRQILGGEIIEENLTPMLTPVLRESSILTDLIAIQNGLYLPPSGIDGYRQVLVNVPNSYTQADEGKVVSNGELIPQTARANPITSNGNYDTTNNDEVTVNVPNSYTQADEGKVVSNGELISQTARANPINSNGNYDTTNNNEVTVNVTPGEVLFSNYKGGDSSAYVSISTTFTTTTTGYYYVSAGGWVDEVYIKINGATSPNITNVQLGGYSAFSYGTVQLQVGDVITLLAGGSGRKAIHGLIVFLHS